MEEPVRVRHACGKFEVVFLMFLWLTKDNQVHVDKVRENSQHFETSHQAGKLMHRFNEQQLEKLMDEEIMKKPDSYSQ